MPATSQKQANLARMALAMKHGHRLKGVSKAGREKARQMAQMEEGSLRDYTHTKKKRGSILTGER